MSKVEEAAEKWAKAWEETKADPHADFYAGANWLLKQCRGMTYLQQGDGTRFPANFRARLLCLGSVEDLFKD